MRAPPNRRALSAEVHTRLSSLELGPPCRAPHGRGSGHSCRQGLKDQLFHLFRGQGLLGKGAPRTQGFAQRRDRLKDPVIRHRSNIDHRLLSVRPHPLPPTLLITAPLCSSVNPPIRRAGLHPWVTVTVHARQRRPVESIERPPYCLLLECATLWNEARNC